MLFGAASACPLAGGNGGFVPILISDHTHSVRSRSSRSHDVNTDRVSPDYISNCGRPSADAVV